MKFLQFYRDGRPTLGVITEKGVVDMSAHPELPQTMLALCQSGDTAALAALLSLLTSVAGLPEVGGGATLAEIQDGRGGDEG